MIRAQVPHLNSEQRARILGEALGWMRESCGDTAVIKYSGHVITDPSAQETFASDMQFLQHVGMLPVVAHGGDPQINTMLDKLGIRTPFHEGVRVTAPEAIEIVRMVPTGQVQRRLMSHLSQRDSPTVGISSEDGALFNTKCRTGVNEKGEEIDFGLVGETMSVDPSAIPGLLDAGHIPAISSITIDRDNTRQTLNINAGATASTLAVALGASKLLMLIDIEGVYSNYPDPGSLLHHTTPSQLRALGDIISSGMIPKVRACLQAIEGDVDAVHVVDGCQMHSVLIEMMTDESTGTIVVPDSVERDT